MDFYIDMLKENENQCLSKNNQAYVMAACDDNSNTAVYKVQVLSKTEKYAIIKYDNNLTEEIPLTELLPVDPSSESGIPELMLLNSINEASLLINLKSRYLKNLHFTNLGKLLIHVKPSRKSIKEPKSSEIFEISTKILKKVQSKNQTLVLVGESQTGKSFLFSRIFKSLFSYNDKFKVVKSALFVIKAFTTRVIQGRISESRALVHGTIYVTEGIPEGCNFECLNMDKDLIFDKKKGNFSVFSMLGTQNTDLGLPLLLKHSKIYNELQENREKYEKKLKNSLENLQILDEYPEIIRILYAIQSLNQVEFIEINSNGTVSKETVKFFQLTCKLLEISEENLKKDLTTFTRTVGKSLISTKLDKYECECRKKALAKLLYSELFKYILTKINKILSTSSENKFVSLIDYPGSQTCKNNSLEELLINYANEKFHQLSISTYFNSKKLDNIYLTDNKPVIDLFENESTGILKLLSDSCTCKSTESLLNTLTSCHLLNEYFEVKGSFFSIYHSFQKVNYDVTYMREKNLDIIYTSLLSCLETSKSLTVKSIYKPGPTIKSLLSVSVPKAISELFSSLQPKNLRFIYCLDPIKDSLFDEQHLLRQIQAYSLIDFILQFKSMLTTSYTSSNFFDKFRLVLNNNWTTKKNIERLCGELGLRTDHFTIKNKQVIISKPGEKILNKHLANFKAKCGIAVLTVQRFWRKVSQKHKLRKFFRAVKRIQALFRGRQVYINYNHLKFSTITIQRWYKTKLLTRLSMNKKMGMLIFAQYLKNKLLQQMKQKSENLALTCQRVWRGYKVRKFLKKFRVSCSLVHYIFNKSWRIIYKGLKSDSALKIQKCIRGFLCRQNLPSSVKLHFIRQKYNKFATKIQKHFKRYMVQQIFVNTKNACKKIQLAWKLYKSRKNSIKRSKSILLIQRRVRIFILRMRKIKEKLSEFLIRETSLVENLRYLEQSQVFSIGKPVHSPVEVKLKLFSQFYKSSTLSTLKLATSGSLTTNIKDQNPFQLEKMNFFTRIIRMNLNGDNSEVYPDLWGNNFEGIVKECIEKEDLLMDIKLGYCHSVALTGKGKLFVWGWNDKNQCLANKKKFRFVKELKDFRILQVACGEDHTVVLTENGEVFAFGDNSKGQLGQGNYLNTNVPVQIPLPAITTISSCNCTTIAISKDSKAYIWPNNSESSLNSSIPAILLPFIDITDVSVGYNFSVLLSSSGQLYTFGNNSEGQLGHGDLTPRKDPTIISSLKKSGEKISSISAGLNHVVAKSSLGKLFTWGGGKTGQLGTNSYKNELLPQQIHSTNTKIGKIVQVSAGKFFSVVLNENRKIFVAGNGKAAFEEVGVEEFLPEFGDKKEFAVVKVQCEWNRMFMVVTCTLCDLRAVPRNYVKVQSGMNQLAAKWGKGIEPPIVETLAPFYSVVGWRRSPLRNS